MLLLWWSALVLLGVFAAIVFRRDAPEVSPPQSSPGMEGLLWLLAVACVGLTLVAHRPDADDAFYVNIAVAAVEAPGQALLSRDTLVGVEGVLSVAQIGNSLRVLTADDRGDARERVGDALASSGQKAGIDETTPNLEDVFVSATHDGERERAA